MPQRKLLNGSMLRESIVPLTMSAYPNNVQALIRRLKTPQQVQLWIHTLNYNTDETMYTIADVVRRRKAHCLEAAMSAAVILEQHGYPPLIMDLESTDLLDHTLFLFRQRGRYGTIGMSRDIGLAGRRPVYKNLYTLVQSYAAPYIDAKAHITGYGVLDLRTLKRNDWRTSPRAAWFVENALNKNYHRKFSTSAAYIAFWRRKFVEFRRQNPNKQPTFYPNQHNWM